MLGEMISTKLETISKDGIEAVLDWKIEELKEKKLPVEAGLADYIALADSNIKDKVDQLKAYKSEIDEAIKVLLKHEKEALNECYGYIKNNIGTDKLKGIAVSSITCKDESVSITKKFVLDEDKDKLVELGYGHYEEAFKEVPATIRINKRRDK